MEKEALGFYISSHPLQVFHLPLRFFANCNVESLQRGMENPNNERRTVKLGGQITRADVFTGKTGNQYGRYVIEDHTGALPFALFGENFKKCCHLLELNAYVMLYGTLALPFVRPGEDPGLAQRKLELKVNEVHLLDTLLETTTKTVYITLHLTELEKDGAVIEMKKEDMDEFTRLIKDNPGKQSYKIHLVDAVGKKSCNMTPTKGGINTHDLLPLLEKLPFVEFDLR